MVLNRARNRGRQMELRAFDNTNASLLTGGEADLAIAGYLAAAVGGDETAMFDLGVAYSTGSNTVECDLIEAHMWFNLAASRGHEEAAVCRADVSDEMTAREIAEAQRRARRWLSEERRAA